MIATYTILEKSSYRYTYTNFLHLFIKQLNSHKVCQNAVQVHNNRIEYNKTHTHTKIKNRIHVREGDLKKINK